MPMKGLRRKDADLKYRSWYTKNLNLNPNPLAKNHTKTKTSPTNF